MANIEIFGTLVRNDGGTNRDKIVQGTQVEGGYFVCNTLPTQGTWATGQLCYCESDSKFYQYNGTSWVEKIFGITSEASQSASGLMSSTDKKKLDGVAEGANKTVVDTTLNASSTNPVQNKVVKSAIDAKANSSDLTSHTGNTTVHITADERTKWNAHAEAAHAPSNAEKNQNAFSNIAVSGQTTVSADTTTDTLTLVAGNNVTITTDATNDKVTIAAKDTTYSSKTASSGGTDVSLVTTGEKYTWNNKVDKVTGKGLSTNDYTTAEKNKLNDIAENANNYSHPTYTAKTSGLYKVAVDNTGHVSATTAVTKSDITALGIPAKDTIYMLPEAGSSLGGVKTGGDVTISRGVITVNDDSHNHVISNVDGLETALGEKAATSDLTSHTENTTVHITSTERTNWNTAKTHADSAHAPSNAEKNQNAFSVVRVTGGSVGVYAQSASDGLTLESSNITITPDGTNRKLTFSVNDNGHNHSIATTSANGFMSAADKRKLDGVAEGATNVTIDTALSDTSVNPVENKVIKEAIDNLSNQLIHQYSEGLEFTSNGDGTCYVSEIGTCTDTDIIIPPTSPNGDKVKSIGDSAFQYCTPITSVVIPEGVTSIGSFAFYGCTELTRIELTNSVISIGASAFFGCRGLKNVVMGNNIAHLGMGVFSNCSSLKNINLSNSLTSIGMEMFNGCSGLENIVIPASITYIGEYAFSGCASLTEIVIPKSVTTIAREAFSAGSSLTIYTDAETQPAGWTLDGEKVVCGVAIDFITLNNKLGDTSLLTTNEKSIVGSINELYDNKAPRISSRSSTLSELAAEIFRATGSYNTFCWINHNVQGDFFVKLSHAGNTMFSSVFILTNTGKIINKFGNIEGSTLVSTMFTWESIYQTKNDDSLTTTDKTITGAINDIAEAIDELKEGKIPFVTVETSGNPYYALSDLATRIKEVTGNSDTLCCVHVDGGINYMNNAGATFFIRMYGSDNATTIQRVSTIDFCAGATRDYKLVSASTTLNEFFERKSTEELISDNVTNLVSRVDAINNITNVTNGVGEGAIQSVGDRSTDGTSSDTAIYEDADGNEVFDYNSDFNTNAATEFKTATGLDFQDPVPYGSIGRYSQTIGGKASAQGKRARAEGTTTIAYGDYSHAEGNTTLAIGGSAHAEGLATVAAGEGSHASGHKTIARGNYSNASGDRTVANGTSSMATGKNTTAKGEYSFSCGDSTVSHKDSTFSAGVGSVAYGWASAAIGKGDANYPDLDTASIASIKAAYGVDSGATSNGVPVKKYFHMAAGGRSFVGGDNCLATGTGSMAYGKQAFAEGDTSFALGTDVHAEGLNSLAHGSHTHAEGLGSFATGLEAVAKGEYSFAAGYDTEATNINAVAVGYSARATGHTAVSLGRSTKAKGKYSFASGYYSTAENDYSFAGNHNTKANGVDAAAFGLTTVADQKQQFVVGRYNKSHTYDEAILTDSTKTVKDANDIIFVVGNGTGSAEANRSNAFEVLKDGRAKVFGTPTEDNDVATKEYVDNKKTGDSVSFTQNLTSGTEIGTITIDGSATTLYAPAAATPAQATEDTAGVVKVSSVNTSAVEVNAESTTAGRYYPVELNSDGKAIVNVPWENNNNKVTQQLTTYGDALSYPVLASAFTTNYTYSSQSGPLASYAQVEKTIYITPSTGALTATSFNATSDARLKKNFTEYTSDKSILDLPVYRFDFIDGPDNQIGCKAQDLQEICPELVTENTSGYLSVKESKLVYLLLEEVKKLRQELNDLKER